MDACIGVDERRACGSPSPACRSTSRCSSCSGRCAAASASWCTATLAAAQRPSPPAPAAPIDFSLFYFSSDESTGGAERYRLLTRGRAVRRRHGFAAVWTPERHFHAFGGLYPNPAVTSAAIAAITHRVEIRAGSVVLPLHHPVRVAEEWSVVDNLSNGRVGISFASGWQPNDFVLAPENHRAAQGGDVRAVADGAPAVARRAADAARGRTTATSRCARCRARCRRSCRSGSPPPAIPRRSARPARSAPTC